MPQRHNRPLTSRLAAHVGTQHIHLLDKLDFLAQEIDVFLESWLEELAKRNVRDRVFLVAVLNQLPNIITKYVYDQLTRAGRETAEMMAVAIVRSLPVEYYPLEMETQESIGSIKAVFRKGVAAVKGYVGKKVAYTKDEFKRRLHQYLIEPLSADMLEKIVLSGARNLAWLKQRIFQTVNVQKVADTVVQATSAGKSQKEITAILKNEYAVPKRDAVRITRNEGTRIATESNLQAYEQLGDAVIGFMINEVLDSVTRPAHRKRNGTIYYKNPGPGQKGLDEMPRPPLEADGSMSWNCRGWLTPVFAPLEKGHVVGSDITGKVIPDPLIYQDWFGDAPERLKRRAVGSRRYDVVTAKHGPDASYFHFIDPDNGDLLDLDSIRTETATDTAARVMQGRQQANDARLQRRDVLLFGSNQ